jgi:hypothetical protein
MQKEYPMKHVATTIVTLFLLGASAALPVHAQQTSPQPGNQPNASQPGSPSGNAQPGSESHVVSSSYMAQVTGEVTSVDRSSGKLTLRTADGQLTATFPPEAVQHVQTGDQVTVAIGLMERNAPSASPSMGSGAGTTNAPSSGSGSSGSSETPKR